MSTNKVSTRKVTNVSKLSKRPRLAGLVQPETAEQASEHAVVPGPSGVVTRLSDVVPEHLRWLWPGRLPVGKLVLLDGDPGTGKSTIAVDWAARVSTGGRWPDGSSCPKGDVLVLSAEDGLADTVRPRLDAAAGGGGGHNGYTHSLP